VVVIHHLEEVENLCALSWLPGVLLVSSTVVQGEFELRREVDCECRQFTHRKGQGT
jgi:hypothetical protein